jgi:hypothetical protein
MPTSSKLELIVTFDGQWRTLTGIADYTLWYRSSVVFERVPGGISPTLFCPEKEWFMGRFWPFPHGNKNRNPVTGKVMHPYPFMIANLSIHQLSASVRSHRPDGISVGTFTEDNHDLKLCRVVYLTLGQHGTPH